MQYWTQMGNSTRLDSSYRKYLECICRFWRDLAGHIASRLYEEAREVVWPHRDAPVSDEHQCKEMRYVLWIACPHDEI